VQIVDAHQHVGSLADSLPHDPERAAAEALPLELDAQRRIDRMDSLGISWALLQPSHGYLRSEGLKDTMDVNDRMTRYRSFAPDRFKALGTTEPLYGEAGLREVERIGSMPELDGIAWHHRFQGCFIDSKWMWPTLRLMIEHRLVPLVHVHAESSLEAHWRLQRLALEFPELTFIAVDGMWTFERSRHILETARLTPNVIWDICGPAFVSIEEWVLHNGSESLCFSVGGAYNGEPSTSPLLKQVERAAISDTDKANILGANLIRAFSQSVKPES
jgi:uncharacterized protein